MTRINIDRNDDSLGSVQPGVQQIAPARVAADLGTATGPDAPSSPQTDRDGAADRDQRGRFTRGNRASVRHSLHTPVLPELARVAREGFLRRALVDEGDEPPTRRGSLVEYRSVLHGQIVLVSNALERFGLFDRRGKLRVLWLTKLESLISTAVSIDRLLGLARQEKHALDVSPEEWLRGLSSPSTSASTDPLDPQADGATPAVIDDESAPASEQEYGHGSHSRSD